MQIIVIGSAQDLAGSIARALSMDAPHIMATIAACLRPIEVPSEARELAQSIEDECFDPWEMNKEKGHYEGSFDAPRAAALITAYSRTIPRAMLKALWKAAYDEGGIQPFISNRDREIARITEQFGYRVE